MDFRILSSLRSFAQEITSMKASGFCASSALKKKARGGRRSDSVKYVEYFYVPHAIDTKSSLEARVSQ